MSCATFSKMARTGFRRILIVNGHGGNDAVRRLAQEWSADGDTFRVIVHNWWNAPRTLARTRSIDPIASHASWMENSPRTRLSGVDVPQSQRAMVDLGTVRSLDAVALRAYLGDGNFGGFYQRPDDDMLAIWGVAIEETRALLTCSWSNANA